MKGVGSEVEVKGKYGGRLRRSVGKAGGREGVPTNRRVWGRTRSREPKDPRTVLSFPLVRMAVSHGLLFLRVGLNTKYQSYRVHSPLI